MGCWVGSWGLLPRLDRRMIVADNNGRTGVDLLLLHAASHPSGSQPAGVVTRGWSARAFAFSSQAGAQASTTPYRDLHTPRHREGLWSRETYSRAPFTIVTL
jgi:hypothetical protein